MIKEILAAKAKFYGKHSCFPEVIEFASIAVYKELLDEQSIGKKQNAGSSSVLGMKFKIHPFLGKEKFRLQQGSNKSLWDD